MPISRLVGAVAISLMVPVPATAQQAMSEPAYCAFFYPYANCQNKGPGNPYTDPNYRRGPAQNDTVWSGDQTVGMSGKRSKRHRSESSAIHMQ